MQTFKAQVAEQVGRALSLEPAVVEPLLELPKITKVGDVALSCQRLSAVTNRSAAAIAEAILSGVPIKEEIAWIQEKNGFINFRAHPAGLAKRTVQAVLTTPWGHSKLGAGKRILIDYGSPNIAKRFAIYHLRTAVIGAALKRIFETQGYDVVSVSMPGDWGLPFGAYLCAFLRWGSEVELREDPIGLLNRLYVQFHKEAKQAPELWDEAQALFAKLEAGDETLLELWRRFKKVSLEHFERIYARLNISFDQTLGESDFADRAQHVLRAARQAGIAAEEDGVLLVPLKSHGIDANCLLSKSDGSSLYATRDIAAAMYRQERWGFDRMIYVVGSEQRLHFEQVFKVCELLGFEWASGCVHVDFGLYELWSEEKQAWQRGATRKGVSVMFEDVLQAVTEAELELLKRDGAPSEELEPLAETIAIGAIVFHDLKNARQRPVQFRIEEVLKINGRTGPYLMYTHARLCSVLKGQRVDLKACNFGLLEAPLEMDIVRALALYPEVLQRAAQTMEPSLVASHLLKLGRLFARYWSATEAGQRCYPIVSADAELTLARCCLAAALRKVLAHGLALLGVEAPKAL